MKKIPEMDTKVFTSIAILGVVEKKLFNNEVITDNTGLHISCLSRSKLHLKKFKKETILILS